MGRLVIAFLMSAGVAAAAPPPKESPENRLHRLFGTPFDPEKDCTFTLEGSQLKIKIPGTPHRFTPGYETDHSVAPRARQEWAGDFDVRVKVLSVSPPGPKSDVGGMTAAGLFLSGDGDNFTTISKYMTRADDGDGAAAQFLFQHHLPDANGSGLIEMPAALKGKPVYFRLVRERNAVTGYTSGDGITWTSQGTQKFAWPEKVWVGVFASHGVNHPVEAAFEDFRIAKLKDENSK